MAGLQVGGAVDELDQIAERDNAWAVGDSAAIPSGENTFYPQLAPVAMQSGRHVAAQILRQLDGKPLTREQAIESYKARAKKGVAVKGGMK